MKKNSKKNIELVKSDPVIRYTTCSFARLGYSSIWIKFGLRQELPRYMESYSLHKYPGLSQSFPSHAEALKHLFPEIYNRKIESIKIDKELRDEFLGWVPDSRLFGCNLESTVKEFLKERHPEALVDEEKNWIRDTLDFQFPRAFGEMAGELQRNYVDRFFKLNKFSFGDSIPLYKDLYQWIGTYSPARIPFLMRPEAYDPIMDHAV